MSYEKYWENRAYVSGTLFYKDLKSYVYTQSLLRDFSGIPNPSNGTLVPASNVGIFSQPANGQGVPPGQTPEYLHGPAYGAAVNPNGTADCEVAQRGYPRQLNHLDPSGRNLETDIHNPGSQGTNWAGLARVPAGETFSRAPQTGPQIPFVPANP